MFTSTGYEFMHEVTMIDKTRARHTSRCESSSAMP